MDSEYPESDMNEKKTLPDRIKFEYSQKKYPYRRGHCLEPPPIRPKKSFPLLKILTTRYPQATQGLTLEVPYPAPGHLRWLLLSSVFNRQAYYGYPRSS